MDLVRLVLGVLVTASLAACGGSSGKGTTCGAGTMLENGMCVGSAGVTCGSNTTLQNGMCVGMPPTTCGPGTTLQNGACVVDTNAPPPVGGLTASLSGTTVTLSWTASNNAAGYVVARLVAGAYDAPAALTSYTTGQTLPGGATVVAAGSATTASDTIATPGRYAYMVWPVTASLLYGLPREAAIMAPLPAQTATVTIDVANAAATVAAQPANVTLAAANVAYDSAAGTVSFDLTATQGSAGPLYNLKAIVAAPSVGTVANPSGTADSGDPFVELAAGAVLPATPATATISITGVAATDTVTLPLTIVESSIGLAGASVVDLAGGGGNYLQLPELRGRGESASLFTDGMFDPIGRYFYGVNRWTTGLFRVDLATGDVTAVQPVVAGSGEGMCLVPGGDGYAYAAWGLDAHRHGNATGIVFARIDLATMTAVAVSPRQAPAAQAQAHGCALHGTTLAMGFGGAVYLADTGTMKFTDADPSTADVIDPIAMADASDVQRLVFSADGATLYVSLRQSSTIDSVDLATSTASTYHQATDRVLGFDLDAAGTLWYGVAAGGLFSFDGTTETQVPGLTTVVMALGPWSGTKVTLLGKTGEVQTVDTADGTITRAGAVNSDRLGHAFATYLTP